MYRRVWHRWQARKIGTNVCAILHELYVISSAVSKQFSKQLLDSPKLLTKDVSETSFFSVPKLKRFSFIDLPSLYFHGLNTFKACGS